MSQTTSVLQICDQSPFLEDVIRLWGENRKYLGFFPEGAFLERARQKNILVAVIDGQCVGYVLFYKTGKRRVTITHLCVASTHRGQGIAERLIEHLRSITREQYGIGLHCRRDFPAWGMWPKLGFVAVNEKEGRSKTGDVLTFYFLEHSHPSLFHSSQTDSDECCDIAIDANIFFDLDEPGRMGGEETQGLLADWLQPLIRLCITQELPNEIQRNNNAAERQLRMASAQRYECLDCPTEKFDLVQNELEQQFGPPSDEQEESDYRQLARAIGAGVTIFVTRDGPLLSKRDQVYEHYGLSIVRPSQLVGQFEDLRSEGEYQRARLSGTSLQIRKIHGNDEISIDNLCEVGERRSGLEHRLREWFANPDKYHCFIVVENNASPLALYVLDISTDAIRIPIFRVAGNLNGWMPNTLVKALVSRIVQEAVKRNVPSVTCDKPINHHVETALLDCGFLPDNDEFTKITIRECGDSDRVAELLPDTSIYAELKESLENGVVRDDPTLALDVEHILWPTKLLNCGIRTFIVPIRPEWASELFDSGLASHQLWGVPTEPALNIENVYYRSRQPNVPSCSGRLLWYVSDQSNVTGSKCIRACSQLDEVIIGEAKELYRRYRRFGVYEWESVLETAKGNPNGQLMVLKFRDTELFSDPIGYDETLEILRQNGISSRFTFPSPVEVPEPVFQALYRRGFSGESK